MGILGIPAAGFLMLPFAILSDVADYDESISGQRREAIFFGVQAIFQKSMIGVSILAFSLIALMGSDNKVYLFGLQMIPLVAGAAFLISFLLFLKYPIREKNGQIILLK